MIIDNLEAFWNLSVSIASSAPLLSVDSSEEWLTQQVTLLHSANSQLTNSFDSIHNLIRILQEVFTTVGVLLAFVSLIGGASLFKATRLFIKEEIEREIAQRVEERLDDLEKLLEQRSILKQTKLTYLQPGATGITSKEFRMIRTQVPASTFVSDISDVGIFESNVVVLDLANSNLDGTDQGQEIAIKLAMNLPYWSTLVLYTPNNQSPVVQALRDQPKNQLLIDFAPANTKVTLIERVIGSAFASSAIRNQ